MASSDFARGLFVLWGTNWGTALFYEVFKCEKAVRKHEYAMKI
jgi:hypothetical protein